MARDTLRLQTQFDTLEFDSQTLALVSLRSGRAPEQEFILSREDYPVFVIGYLDDKRQYRLISSQEATHIDVRRESEGVLSADFHGLGGKSLDIHCSVHAEAHDRFARFRIAVDNRGAYDIVDVQYPFVVCPYHLGGTLASEAIALPHGYGSGQLLTGDLEFGGGTLSQRLRGDSFLAWEFCAREGDCNHYPGMQYAQYMAYYNDRAGLYIACDDTQANVKRFQVLHRDPGIRFGISHVGDWPADGRRALEYDVVVTSFSGDWYDATDIYREWSMRQPWFVPLTRKDNVPQWLLDSPAYVTIRPAGELDLGSVTPIEQFLPYEKCIPLLEDVSRKVDAPLSVVMMGWERAGSWVYPDAFPPVGGEESMVSFIRMARERGWHVGSFCSGTRWAFHHAWNGYDGRDYLESIHADEGIARQADGSRWLENWDAALRASWAGCLATGKMRDTGLGIVGLLVDWGMECLQYLDQNNGGSTFPCFAADHGHPDKPGKWMHETMRGFVERMHALAREKGEDAVVHSAESGLNETCIPFFQQTELRVYPDNYGSGTIPIYQYLFHECIVLQGMMGNAPEPYHLAIRNAVNCVLGSIPGGVLTGDGTLLDKDTNNWANWEPKLENSDEAFMMIRTVLALRRGPGRPYLVFGRMLRPAAVQGIQPVCWSFRGRDNRIDDVFHSAWQSPQGTLGIVLSNWTRQTRTVRVRDGRIPSGARVAVHVSAGELAGEEAVYSDEGIDVRVPAHGCTLVEYGG